MSAQGGAVLVNGGGVLGPVGDLIGYGAKSLIPTAIPSPGAHIEAWNRGMIRDSTLIKGLSLNGIRMLPVDPVRNFFEIGTNQLDINETARRALRGSWQSQLLIRTWAPPLQILFDMANRGLITERVFAHWLQQLGIINNPAISTLAELRKIIPGPSDIIRMAVREAFTPELVEALSLDQEFPPDFEFWAARQGLGDMALPDPNNPTDVRQVNWARMFWRAHWQLPAPEQGYRMFQRLRPGRVQRFAVPIQVPDPTAPLGPDGRPTRFITQVVPPPPMTAFDLQQLLRALDFAPIWRDRLRSIAFRVVGRRDIRRLRQFDVISAEETVEKWRDLGYAPEDAKELADLTERQRLATARGAAIRKTKQQIEKALRLGVIDDTKARQLLEQHGLNLGEANRALVNMELDIRIKNVDDTLKAIRRMFFNGLLSNDEVLDKTRVLNLDPGRISTQLAIWQVQRDAIFKDLTTAQIIDLLKRGILPLPTAVERLRKLGYEDKDIRSLLLRAAQDVQAQQAQFAIKFARSQAERQKAIRAQQKEVERLIRRARSDLARSGSPAMLARWVKKDLLSPQAAYVRLRRLAWPRADANRLIREALQDDTFSGDETQVPAPPEPAPPAVVPIPAPLPPAESDVPLDVEEIPPEVQPEVSPEEQLAQQQQERERTAEEAAGGEPEPTP